jgi:hypothetical protein
VSNHWSVLPTGQVAVGLYDHSLPDSPRWSDKFLLLPGGS